MQSLDDTRRKWIKDPAWWVVAISAIQVFVISGVIGFVGYLMDRHAKGQASLQEIRALRSRLEQSDRTAYENATYGLLALGPEGNEQIFSYATGSLCIPWQKAMFLYGHTLSLNQNESDKGRAIHMLWSSWLCQREYRDLGMDAELHRVVRNDPAVTCPVVMSRLDAVVADIDKPEHGPSELLQDAWLLSALTDVCEPKTSAFQNLRLKFLKGLQAAIAQRNELQNESNFFAPWLEHSPTGSGPYEGNYDDWAQVVIGAVELFSEGGPKGLEVMWDALEYKSLSSRLIFGQLILYNHKESLSDSNAARARLGHWVQLGLQSKDNAEKYAALSAVGNLNFQEYKDGVQRLAEVDEDPVIRGKARDVLTYRFHL